MQTLPLPVPLKGEDPAPAARSLFLPVDGLLGSAACLTLSNRSENTRSNLVTPTNLPFSAAALP